MIYFGFAIADSMFPSDCDIHRTELSADDVKEIIAEHEITSCCNPSHQATIDAMRQRFSINIPIPATAPQVKLGSQDEVIVMSVRGLPRLDATRHEHTADEIAKATFVFGLWTVR